MFVVNIRCRIHSLYTFPALLQSPRRPPCSIVRSRSREEVPLQQQNPKCPCLLLCVGSGAFVTTNHGTPAFRPYSRSISTISGRCIVQGRGPSLHCCSSWICLFSFVYLTSFGNGLPRSVGPALCRCGSHHSSNTQNQLTRKLKHKRRFARDHSILNRPRSRPTAHKYRGGQTPDLILSLSLSL